MAQVQQIDLQVLKTQFARQEGTIPDRRDNDAPSPVENGCLAAAPREPLPEPVIRFDIPEAPLGEALSRFSRTLNVTWATRWRFGNVEAEDRKSTRLKSSHSYETRITSSSCKKKTTHNYYMNHRQER